MIYKHSKPPAAYRPYVKSGILEGRTKLRGAAVGIIELKTPCPYCGHFFWGEVRRNKKQLWVQCMICGSESPKGDLENPSMPIDEMAENLWHYREGIE